MLYTKERISREIDDYLKDSICLKCKRSFKIYQIEDTEMSGEILCPLTNYNMDELKKVRYCEKFIN